MDIWDSISKKLIHKVPNSAEEFFTIVGREKFSNYIVHSRLGYIWTESDKLFQKLIANVVGDRKCSNILEIGSFVGQGANFFVEAFQSIGLNPHVDCIDLVYPYLEEESDVNYGAQSYHLIKNTEEKRRRHLINIHTGRTRDILPYLDKKFDLIYVDGEHTSGGVYLDLVLSFNKSLPNTLILVDDLSWYGENPVIAGVDTFIKLYASYIKEIYAKGHSHDKSKYGLFKIEKFENWKTTCVMDQLLFICKKPSTVSIDTIMSEIDANALTLSKATNPEGTQLIQCSPPLSIMMPESNEIALKIIVLTGDDIRKTLKTGGKRRQTRRRRKN